MNVYIVTMKSDLEDRIIIGVFKMRSNAFEAISSVDEVDDDEECAYTLHKLNIEGME